MHLEGRRYSAEQVAEKIGAARPRSGRVNGRVTVLPVNGVIGHRANLIEDTSSGIGTSTEVLGQQIDAAVADDSVKAIVLDINSPGGSVHGLSEVVDKIHAARESKPIYAIANAEAFSAAYWIGSAATKFYATPSGMVGSVGTVMMHMDYSKALEAEGVKPTLIYRGLNKVEGNQLEPLTDEARAEFQRIVDSYYEEFVGSVARNRGVSKRVVESTYGQGRAFRADEAKSLGMIDKVQTFDELLASLGVVRQASSGVGADSETPDSALEIRRMKTQFRDRNLTPPQSVLNNLSN